ncbi:methyltransferase family protein [Herbihabitans rhizosphaerae]|uniref:Methyltransferase family protein n=1 Tax=Herbihabitans rhizosphaerae TaxID=1872711 RepID=A0A4Q7KGQ8_9PSEU|nr:class I SAM-dependent methyltransferase [Herbihabitans rhizosphaerae]RZS34309.1 methyltransferase family protein [Herbihabitans rhizosphaerae]
MRSVPSDVPDHRLAELVEGSTATEALTPARALELGSGHGRNAVYLAAHGWAVTGVELDETSVRISRFKAEDEAVPVRFVHGDVTKLSTLDVGDGYTLLMDHGCFHALTAPARDDYVREVSAVAAPGALLVLVAFSKFKSAPVTEEEVRQRFTGWELLAVDPVPGKQLAEYVLRPLIARFLVSTNMFQAYRYQLVRL